MTAAIFRVVLARGYVPRQLFSSTSGPIAAPASIIIHTAETSDVVSGSYFPRCGYDFIENLSSSLSSSASLPVVPAPSTGREDWAARWQDQFALKCNEKKYGDIEREELFTTGKSNSRTLQWRMLQIPAGMVLPPHTHVALEFYTMLSGTLREVRMLGPPLSRDFPLDQEPEPPDMSKMRWVEGAAPFAFNRLRPGDTNVNELGSIHQTFTTTSDSAVLLVLGCGHIVPIPDKRLPVTSLFEVPTVESRERW